jgi:hypothetical protein
MTYDSRRSRRDLGSPDEIVDEADGVRRDRVQRRELELQRLVDRNHTVAAPIAPRPGAAVAPSYG